MHTPCQNSTDELDYWQALAATKLNYGFLRAYDSGGRHETAPR